jgi:Flp pilus assembly protein TadG
MRLRRSMRLMASRATRLSERGSMAVEFVVVAPAFVLLLLLVAAGGQWVSASGQVDGAARDAARAASFGRSPADAQNQAQLAAAADLPTLCSGSAAGLQVSVTPTSGGSAAPFATAGEVQVTVSCSVALAAFRMVGFPGTQTFRAVAVAPLDTFVCRSGAC